MQTLEEAVAAKIELVSRIQAIENQLTERRNQAEYADWRTRACRAKSALTTQLAKTKLEIQRLRTEGMKQRIAARGQDNGLLTELYKLTKSMVAAGVEITHEEQQLLDDIEGHING